MHTRRAFPSRRARCGRSCWMKRTASVPSPLDGVSREEADAWREELVSSGFRLLAGVEKDVKGTVPSGAAAISEVYTDGSVSCSVSHSADLLALYCSLAES